MFYSRQYDIGETSRPRGDRDMSAYGTRPPLGFNFFTILLLVIPGIHVTIAHSSMHSPRKYEACKSKPETLREEDVFLELKVRTKSFYLFQIYKLFIAICQTFILPNYSVYYSFRLSLVFNSIR